MDLLNRPAFDQQADSYDHQSHQQPYGQQQQQPQQQQLQQHHDPDPNKPTTESLEPRGQLIIMAAESASVSSEAMGMDIDASPPTASNSPRAAPTMTSTLDQRQDAHAAATNSATNASREPMASELRGETPSPRAKAADPFKDPKIKSMLSLCLDADTARRGTAVAGRGLPRSVSTPQLVMCAQPTAARAKAWNTP